MIERKQVDKWFIETRGKKWTIIHACTQSAMDHLKSEHWHIPYMFYDLCLTCNERVKTERFRYNHKANKCPKCKQDMVCEKARVVPRAQVALTSDTNLNNLDGDPKCRLCNTEVPKGILMTVLMRRINV